MYGIPKLVRAVAGIVSVPPLSETMFIKVKRVKASYQLIFAALLDRFCAICITEENT